MIYSIKGITKLHRKEFLRKSISIFRFIELNCMYSISKVIWINSKKEMNQYQPNIEKFKANPEAKYLNYGIFLRVSKAPNINFIKSAVVFFLTFLITMSAAYGQIEGSKGAYNHFGLFFGPTMLTNIGNFGFSAKLNYEFQNTPEIGYGATIQGTIARDFEYMISAPIYYYPYKRLKIWGAMGVAFVYSVPYSLDVPPKVLEKLQERYEDEITGNFFLGFGGGWGIDLYTLEPRVTLTPMIEFQLINLEHMYFSFGVTVDLEFLYLTSE